MLRHLSAFGNRWGSMGLTYTQDLAHGTSSRPMEAEKDLITVCRLRRFSRDEKALLMPSIPQTTPSAQAGATAPSEGASASAGLPKTYQPAATEPVVRERWEKSGAFHPDPQRVLRGEAKPYCILIPPPNVTGALHLGHALNNTLQDILTRSHRMKGYETLWMPGTDHAGIATQAVVERRLRAEGKLKGPLRDAMKREEFEGLVWKWKDEYEARITGQLKAMGCSCDFERQRFTMDEICARAVREAFFILFRDGLIYRGKRLVNWDPALQTAVADDECYDEEIDTSFWYLKYPLEAPVKLPDGTTIDHVTVATTRPETYLGDTAIGVNPKDPRASALVGKKVVLPLVGRVIPIVADSYVVLPESMATSEEEKNDPKAKFATGFLKVTPAHDQNDAELGTRHGLAAINMMSPDGKVSDKHGWTDVGEAAKFVGMTMSEARKAVVAEFKARGLLEDIRPYRQSVTFSDRSKAVIEPYLSDQWYVKVTDDRLAGAANRAVAKSQIANGQKPNGEGMAPTDGAMTFYPARYAKTYTHWHDNIRDWCVSRQLWWGHRIPVWRCVDRASAARVTQSQRDLLGFGWQRDARVDYFPSGPGAHSRDFADRYFCVRDPHADDREVVELLESLGFQQDPDVLDTWFSSALWPLSTLGWPDSNQSPETKELLAAFNPTSVLSTAREIITLWVSRMTMMNRYFLGEGQGRGPVPFKDVFIHAVVQDGEGKRMSKSAGNGVDPLDIIASHGADAMRFTLCQMTTSTQDVRMPVVLDEKTGKNTSPKFDAGRNLCNKLWNAARFTLSIFERTKGAENTSPTAFGRPIRVADLSLIDRWMLSRLAASVRDADRALANYEFSDYAETVYKLLWWDFCDWYLEAIKPTVDASAAQRAVLAHALETILRLLHPVAPFITEAIHEQVRDLRTVAIEGVRLGAASKDELLCTAGWPEISASLIDPAAEAQFESLRELINTIRNLRSEKQVAPKRKVTLHAPAEIVSAMGAAPMLVETLAGLEGAVTTAPQSGSAAVAFRSNGVEMHLSNLADATTVDTGAEKERLTKQVETLRKSETALAGRLNNPGYADKAPAKLVEESRNQLAKIREDIAAIEAKLKGL